MEDATYETLVRRILNMRMYGRELADIHDQLKAEGVSEELIYFAWHGAAIIEKENI